MSHLGTSAEADDVEVWEHPEEQLSGQPPVDQGLVVLREHPGDLPLGDAHMDRVTIPIPEQRKIVQTYFQMLHNFHLLFTLK